MTDADRTEKLSDATHEADRRDAQAEGRADRMPTPGEEAIADSLTPDPKTVEHERDMIDKGVNQKGEGRI